MPPEILGVKARRIASRLEICASRLSAAWISSLVECAMAKVMQSFSVKDARVSEVCARDSCAQKNKRKMVVYCFILFDVCHIQPNMRAKNVKQLILCRLRFLAHCGCVKKLYKRCKKSLQSGIIKISISFISLIPCLISPTDDRETTERTPTQLPITKKCFLLISPPKKVDSIPKKVD